MNGHRDPVCGTDVEGDAVKGNAEFEGRTYFFCADECREEFERDPSKYTDKKEDDEDE